MQTKRSIWKRCISQPTLLGYYILLDRKCTGDAKLKCQRKRDVVLNTVTLLNLSWLF